MKKLILCLIFIVTAGSAIAGPGHYYHRPHHNNHSYSHWIAPLILGGVLGAVIVNQTHPQLRVIQPLPPPQYGYQYIQVYDYYCNCYKWALMAIQ